MSVQSIGLGVAIGAAVDAAQGRVVSIADRHAVAPTVRRTACLLGAGSAQIYRYDLQFTSADRAALLAWASAPGHGYDRSTLDWGLVDDGTWAQYALIYAPGQAWSIWGLRRRGYYVEVWRCGDGQTVGRHARMVDALSFLSRATVASTRYRPAAISGRAVKPASARS